MWFSIGFHLDLCKLTGATLKLSDFCEWPQWFSNLCKQNNFLPVLCVFFFPLFKNVCGAQFFFCLYHSRCASFLRVANMQRETNFIFIRQTVFTLATLCSIISKEMIVELILNCTHGNNCNKTRFSEIQILKRSALCMISFDFMHEFTFVTPQYVYLIRD